LVLGTGLASVVHVLNKYHCYPAITLVDIDKEILDWAAAVLPKDYPKEKVSFVAADAMTIIQHCEAHRQHQQPAELLAQLLLNRVCAFSPMQQRM
jgi:spermidine synthase